MTEDDQRRGGAAGWDAPGEEAEVIPPWGTPPPPPVSELPALPAPTVPVPAYAPHGRQGPGSPYPAYRPARTSTYAILSLVAGLLGFVWLGSLLAIVFGHLALGEMRRDPAVGGRGVAVAGLALGYGAIALVVLPLLAGLLLVGVLGL